MATQAAAEGEPKAPPKAQYVKLQPTFVLNFGTDPTGRLKYLRTDIALRVLGDDAATKVNLHSPYLRHQLVFLLSQQKEEMVLNSAGRKELRKLALNELRAAMSKLEGSPLVEDLFFENFVAQN